NVVTASNATLTVTGDPVGEITVPTSSARYSLSSATVGSAATPTENVRASLVFTHPSGLAAGDMAVDYRSLTHDSSSCVADGGIFWCPLTLTPTSGTLTAFFGAASGFPLTD